MPLALRSLESNRTGSRRASAGCLVFAAGFVLFAAATGCRRGRDAAPSHLVVVSIDTLRADCLLGDGPRRARTPTIDALARDGLVLRNAHAHVPLTLPSHATLLAGRLPPALRLHDNSPFPLRGDVPTLASWLAVRGFSNDAVIGGQPLARGCGLERGFERYDDPPRGAAGATLFAERDAREVTDHALAAWQRPTGGRRRFLFVHYFDPHQPYAPPDPFVAGEARDPAARYLGEVAFVDSELARLIAALRSSGERCLLAVVSDHGEGLGDHGERTHGHQIFESTLHVPMVLAEIEGEATSPPAGLRACDGARLVGMVDLLPTLLRELAVEPPPALDGRALQDPTSSPESCYVESLASALAFGWAQATGVRCDGATLVRAGADVPDSIDGLGVVAGESDERLLVDAGASPPPEETLAALRAALVTARSTEAPADETAPSLAPLVSLGYVGGAADRARHALLPFGQNAALPSPLQRRAEIDAVVAAVERLQGGDAAGAELDLTRVLDGDAGNRAARFFRARARLELNGRARDGRAARRAADDLEALLAVEPSYVGAALLHAKALGLAGEFDAAFASLARLAAEGERAPVEHLLGSLLVEKERAGRLNPRHDLELGCSHLLRALELDPDDARLAADVERLLLSLARGPSPPPWVALDLERLKRRRGRRYRACSGRYSLGSSRQLTPRERTT